MRGKASILLGAAAVLLAAGCGGTAVPASEPGPLLSSSAPSASAAPSPPGARPPRLLVGLAVYSVADYQRSLMEVVKPDYVDQYVQWGDDTRFDAREAQQLMAAGVGMKITWQPWSVSRGPYQPAYSLSQILSGRYDAYIRQWADDLAQYGDSVTIRFAHEMNGNWYPWGAGVNGNTPGQYVAVWQHVHGIFAAAGATNVHWEWAPNQRYDGDAGPLQHYYPGDALVDQVGLSAYNWGEAHHLTYDTHWKDLAQLIDATAAEVQTFTAKPMTVAETGSTDIGGDKASWITQMFQEALVRPYLTAVTYFNIYDTAHDADWRLEGASADAFRRGLASTRS